MFPVLLLDNYNIRAIGKGTVVSKNLVIFLLLIGGAVYFAHKNMQSKLMPPKAAKNVSEEPLDEVETVEEVVEEVPDTAYDPKRYREGFYACPESIKIKPYGLDSTPTSSGFYFKEKEPMKLVERNYGKDKITCRYNSGFGGFFFLYQSIKGLQCRKLSEGYGYQCDDGSNQLKSYPCWEIRTSSTGKPFLRFQMITSGNEDISKTRGWEYEIPKGHVDGVRQNSRSEMECAYSIPISGDFIITNRITKYKECYANGNGVSCN